MAKTKVLKGLAEVAKVIFIGSGLAQPGLAQSGLGPVLVESGTETQPKRPHMG